MVTVAVSSFNDLCDIYRRKSDSASIDSLSGEILVLYDSSPSMSTECGLSVGPQQRNERGQIITIDADAILRVAAGTDIEVKDKVVARTVSYIVDGVTFGRDVTICKLQEVKI
jgi:transcription elongation factor